MISYIEQRKQKLEKTQLLADIRMSVCQTCENFGKIKRCKLCGCFMPAKVRLKNATCPAGKW